MEEKVFWVSYNQMGAVPLKMTPSSFVAELACAFYRSHGISFCALGSITQSGVEVEINAALSSYLDRNNFMEPFVLAPQYVTLSCCTQGVGTERFR